VLLAVGLIGLAVLEPAASTWISDAAQAEFCRHLRDAGARSERNSTTEHEIRPSELLTKPG